MNEMKISKSDAICMMLMIMINTIILNVPNLIILSTGSSAIINVIYISVLGILFSIILSKLFKNFLGKDILDISFFLGGKILQVFVGIFFVFFLLILSIVAVRYLCNSIKIIYFNTSPLVYVLLFFIFPATFINKIGLKSISSINKIFIYIILLSFFILFSLSYKNISISKLFPVLGKGFKETFITGITNIFAFSNMVLLFLLPSLLKGKNDYKKVAVNSTILSAVILIFSITTFILTIPITTKSDEMLSVYLLTRMIGFGNFLERFDAFFVFSWIVTLLSSLSISIFFILRIIKKTINIKNEKALSYPIGLIILGGCLVIKNYSQIKYLGNTINKYGFIILVFAIGISLLVFANYKKEKEI